MKTITIDLKSFFVGALAMGAVLLMANKPAAQPATQPQPGDDTRRYQAVGVDKYAIILDTKTGQFLYEYPAAAKARWTRGDFEQLSQPKK